MTEEHEEQMMWQTAKQVCMSIKHYFEAHLALRVMLMQRSLSSFVPALHQPLPPFKVFQYTFFSVKCFISSQVKPLFYFEH